MSTAVEELAELQLFTADQAAEIMSGDREGLVKASWIEEQRRLGRISYTPVGRRNLYSRAQIAAMIAGCSVEATTHAPRRRT